MKIIYKSLLVPLFISYAISCIGQYQEFEADLDPRFWEDPDDEHHREDDVFNLDKLGVWTYYKENDSLGRIDIFERHITCKDCNTILELCGDKVNTHSISSCDITYEINDADCEDLISPYWQDPIGGIYYEQTLYNVKVDGTWYLFLSDRCPYAVDSIEVENCEIPLNDDICDDINLNNSGDGNWSSSYMSTGNGEITFVFDTRSVPDQLIISINGVVVANSGNYSSSRCTDTYGNCIGTVSFGCGSDYVVDIPISYGDILDVDVFGNVCGLSSTYWDLTTICNSNYTDNSPLLDRSRLDDIDDATSILYFPNPASNEISIKSFGEVIPEKLQIVDNMGRLILEFQISSSLMTVDTKNLMSGVYMFKAIYNTYTDTQLIAISK